METIWELLKMVGNIKPDKRRRLWTSEVLNVVPNKFELADIDVEVSIDTGLNDNANFL